jgi:negative regulator of flagellin synthesis FlgM
MIDPIGAKPGTVQDRPVALGRDTKVVALGPVRGVESTAVAETEMRAAAREMAARPPVDPDRVEKIKRALQEGRFPITPSLIADRLIAAELMWAERHDKN